MHGVGLSGRAFIPLLSSFACAVPGIMATRTIENPRDRLTTILISPLMSCSARLPVYFIMITTFIPERDYLGGYLTLRGLTLFGMYAVGILTAVPVAWLLKKTLLRGETPPFLIELPSYKFPDWRTILLRVYDRGKAFTVRAGTIILAVSIVVWALAYFPRPPEPLVQHYAQARVDLKRGVLKDLKSQCAARHLPQMSFEKLQKPAKDSVLGLVLSQALEYESKRDSEIDEAHVERGSAAEKKIQAKFDGLKADLKKMFPNYYESAEELLALRHSYNDRLEALENEEVGAYRRQSLFGRMGHSVEPAFKPLGWDWRISMAAIASFPAREVIVSTLGTIFNQGTEADAESAGMRDALRSATWDNQPARKLFNIPVALSIMVFFALCSQCAATLATIKRETNTWRWPIFSFTYMTVLAYFGALVTYQLTMALHWG